MVFNKKLTELKIKIKIKKKRKERKRTRRKRLSQKDKLMEGLFMENV